MDHLISYISHTIVRATVYKEIRHLPTPVLLLIAAVACFLIVGRRVRRRR